MTKVQKITCTEGMLDPHPENPDGQVYFSSRLVEGAEYQCLPVSFQGEECLIVSGPGLDDMLWNFVPLSLIEEPAQ